MEVLDEGKYSWIWRKQYAETEFLGGHSRPSFVQSSFFCSKCSHVTLFSVTLKLSAQY